MTTTNTGHKAERAAANYLEMRGFEVLELNWRRPRCEIDVIARKNSVMYFVEVKYRKNDHQGSGLDYITNPKLKQMSYAAQVWVDDNKYQGEYQLAAVEVAGIDFTIEHFIDELI